MSFQFYVMGMLGLRAGVRAEVSFGLFAIDLASIGAVVEFGPYIKLWGYFFYVYTRLRPAGTDTWKVNEQMLGAMYLEFGLYLNVKFKAQALGGLIKYEPTLYAGEYPLLSAGVEKNVYGFAHEPAQGGVLLISDEDSDSSNGIAMQLPESYRYMKTVSLTSGQQVEDLYGNAKFHFRVSNPAFSVSDTGRITVSPPDGERFLESNLTITWRGDKLSFSKYDIAITIPLVWTNMSTTELDQRFTAKVAVGNEVVWSQIYSRIDSFDLPAEEEILERIGYYNYEHETLGNLMYSDVGGYADADTTGLRLTADQTWYFDLTRRTYTLNVDGVQNADGSSGTRSYTTTYGNSFRLNDLMNTGANNPPSGPFTKFSHLSQPGVDEDADGTDDAFAPDTQARMGLDTAAAPEPGTQVHVKPGFVERYGFTANVTAQYRSTAHRAKICYRHMDLLRIVRFFRLCLPH